MILIHPSSLGCIMTNAKSKKPEDLSAGAKTYCKDLAKQFVYGFEKEISNKYLDKGTICEEQSIALYNEVFFTNHKKNTERRTNKWLTGECDILARDRIIDIKSSWSLATFPAFTEDAHDAGYEWQGRAYMMLWDVDLFELAYCMVSTPPELMGWEPEDIHYVDHIDPLLRVTTIQYERCAEREELIKIKCEAAQKYVNEMIEQIANDHQTKLEEVA
jgi:hypothetical protein